MKAKKLNQKGFTLIEIIVVIVILAILAALIIPRFLAQPERAAMVEANIFLGAIHRARDQFIDLGGNVATLTDLNWSYCQMLCFGIQKRIHSVVS